MHKAVLLPPRLGIWEGQITHVPHHRYPEVLLFVNTPLLAVMLMVAARVPMVIPMTIPTPAIRTKMTAVTIKEARVVAMILKIRVRIRVI